MSSSTEADRRLIAEVVGETVGSSREALWIADEALASTSDAAAAQLAATEMARRRAAGEPLQHVLGHWSFRRIEVDVDRRALVPRPETEVVVGRALEELEQMRGAGALVVVDLGTGSGVIALALADEAAGALVVHATDADAEALSLAQSNARKVLGEDCPVSFHRGSWFEALPTGLDGRVDLVVSNPPYVSESEWEGLDPVVRDFDPYGALVAGVKGTEAITAIVGQAPRYLSRRGALVVEIAPHQRDEVLLLAEKAGFGDAFVEPDLAGRPRVLVARR